MSLKTEIKELLVEREVAVEKLANLKKTFLESEVSGDLFDDIRDVEQILSGIQMTLSQKKVDFVASLEEKINSDFDQLQNIEESLKRESDRYSRRAGCLIHEAVNILQGLGTEFGNEAALDALNASDNAARRHSVESENFVQGLHSIQKFELPDFAGMRSEIERIKSLKPGSDEASEFIGQELESLFGVEESDA